MMCNPHVRALGVALGLMVLMGGVGAQKDSAKPAPEPKPALVVELTQPTTGPLGAQISASGTITPWQEAVVSAQIQGLRLVAIQADVGDAVKAGQVLARFADESVLADLAMAQAAAAEAEAALLGARADAERARAVQGTGALSSQAIAQYLTAEKMAEARVLTAKAQVQAQQIRASQTRVLAPDAGLITAKTATLGAVPNVGEPLFRMVRQHRLEWRARLTSSELSRIRVGQSVQVYGPEGGTVQGKVRLVSPSVDAQTREALVMVDLPASGLSQVGLKSGMFARGSFALGQRAALTVGSQSVVLREGHAYVFTVSQSTPGAIQRLAQRKVKLGVREGGKVEILDGVSANTWIVAQGGPFLNDGDWVKVRGAAEATAK